MTGCSWQTAERLLNYEVSDTTLRARRDEWIEAGVFEDRGRARRSRPTTELWAWTSPKSPWTGPPTKPPPAVPAPAATPLTGANPVGSGPCSPTAGGIPVGWSRRRRQPPRPGPVRAHTRPPPRTAACSKTSRPCTWIAATTATTRPPPAPPTGASTTSSAPAARPRGTATTQNHHPTRAAMARRTHQLVAVELRTTPPQHRPVPPPPTRPTRPRHRPTHHCIKLINWRNRWNPPSGPIR